MLIFNILFSIFSSLPHEFYRVVLQNHHHIIRYNLPSTSCRIYKPVSMYKRSCLLFDKDSYRDVIPTLVFSVYSILYL